MIEWYSVMFILSAARVKRTEKKELDNLKKLLKILMPAILVLRFLLMSTMLYSFYLK